MGPAQFGTGLQIERARAACSLVLREVATGNRQRERRTRTEWNGLISDETEVGYRVDP